MKYIPLALIYMSLAASSSSAQITYDTTQPPRYAPATPPLPPPAPPKWRYLTLNSNSEEIYVSVRKKEISKGIFRIWSKQECPLADTVSAIWQRSGKVREIMWLDEFDCNTERYRILQMTVQFLDGSTRLVDGNGKWIYVPPDSIADAILEDVCSTPQPQFDWGKAFGGKKKKRPNKH